MIDAMEVARGVGDESACTSIAKIQALLSRQSTHDELSQCTRLRTSPLKSYIQLRKNIDAGFIFK